MLIAIIALYVLVGLLGLGLLSLSARFRSVETVAMYLGLERYQEILADAEERARVEAARRMIDGEVWG